MRVTPERVREAYAATGARPLRGTWERSDPEVEGRCLCPLAALVVAAGESVPDDERDASEHLQLPERYVAGFVHAVDDGACQPSARDLADPDYVKGAEDGAAVARALWLSPRRA